MVALENILKTLLKPNEIFHNGNAYSFDYDGVQIDLIFTPDEDYESTLNYMGGNDLGNFLGRLSQTIGMKFGQEGLWYNHFSDANTKTKIIVSKDYPKIFEFLGLDYNRWVEGFDTLEDIFDYAISSSLFNPEMFQLKELNKINRERNLKRASYMSFLEYIEDKPAHPDYDKNIIKICKGEVIDVIKRNFPEANIDLHLAEIEYKAAKKKLINAKFNGKIIKEKYGLEGKELGEAIKNFKGGFCAMNLRYENDYDFNNLIIDSNVDSIYRSFEEINHDLIK